jgi:hypothetical protein
VTAFKLSGLKSITFDKNINIGILESGIFHGCSALTDIIIPASVTSIKSDAFSGCISLRNIIFEGNVDNITIDTTAFNNIIPTEKIIFYNYNTWTSENFNKINLAFNNLDNNQKMFIRGLKIFDTFDSSTAGLINITKIYLNLESIIIPARLNNKVVFILGDSTNPVTTDTNTPNLKHITFADDNNLKAINSRCFKDYNKLVSIKIPPSVTSAGTSAFENTINLSTVDFLENKLIVRLGNSIFLNSGLESIKIPSSVTLIDTNAFKSTLRLDEIIFPEDSKLDTINNNAFELSGLMNIMLPSRLKKINTGAFKDSKLTDIIIPASVTSIGIDAFNMSGILTSVTTSTAPVTTTSTRRVSSLTSITFEENIKLDILEEGIFKGCNALTSIIIPKSVTLIKNSAFEGCTSLTSVFFEDDIINITISKNVFAGITSNITFYNTKWDDQRQNIIKEGFVTSDLSFIKFEITSYIKDEDAIIKIILDEESITIPAITKPTELSLSTQEGIVQISPLEVKIDIAKLLSIDSDINKSIEKILKDIYTEVKKYTPSRKGDILYIYIDGEDPSKTTELFDILEGIKSVIFVFRDKTDKAITSLLNIDIKSLKSVNYINYILLIIIILLICYILYNLLRK